MPQLAPTFNEVLTPYLERWAGTGAFDWGAEIDSLMSDFVFQWALGAKLDSKDVSEWAYSTLVVGPLWLPRPMRLLAPAQQLSVPGTAPSGPGRH